MATTNINIRMDAELKRQFEAFCNDMGMTMTTAFNIFAKKVVREYRIPFEIGGEVPTPSNVATTELEPAHEDHEEEQPNKEQPKEVENPSKPEQPIGKTYTDIDLMMKELLY
jgi:DNA-damage-inducible protein J